jgi:hypothetical protein
MAFTRYHNITGSSGVDIELIPPDEPLKKPISSITITNTHATADATVTLFIHSDALGKTYHILHTVALPADTSLLLDNASMFSFSRVYGLYITVGSSDTLDVLLNQ